MPTKQQLVPTPTPSDFLPVARSVRLEAEFLKFAIWYGTPPDFREPENQKEFAETMGVSQDTLVDWKKRQDFHRLVFLSLSNWAKNHIPDVVGGLFAKSLSEKVSASDVELFFRIAGTEISKPKSKKK